MVDISIITVCYNDLVSLKRTLSSVQNLEGKVSFEHLIVDGGSKDGTVEFLNTLNRKISRLFLNLMTVFLMPSTKEFRCLKESGSTS